MFWWAGKEQVREYLKKLNQNGKVRFYISHYLLLIFWFCYQVLEYSLFQPGLFLDYLAFPYKTAKYVDPLNTMFDFQNRRAIVVDGHDFSMTFTTAQDLASVVARAVDYEGEWPVAGGSRGNIVTASQILKIGERVRGLLCHSHNWKLSFLRQITGHPFTVETVKLEDLEAGKLKTSWVLETRHPSVPEAQAESFLTSVLIGTLLSGAKGAWTISDEFNRILPDYKFTHIEDFLTKVWAEKP